MAEAIVLVGEQNNQKESQHRRQRYQPDDNFG
jgi:hypothetical protein